MEEKKTRLRKEEILECLRQRGCRITKQRELLLDIILESDCTSCKEIYYLAVKKMPQIGTATIYRMITSLEEIGVIKRKNFYQICSEEDRLLEQCVVEFSDDTLVELDKENIKKVMECGLKACGYSMKSKVKQVRYVEP